MPKRTLHSFLDGSREVTEIVIKVIIFVFLFSWFQNKKVIINSLTGNHWYTYRARRGYWENLKPSSGRPKCASLSTPDNWGVTAGDKDLCQHKESTTQEEMDAVISQAKQRAEVVNGSHWQEVIMACTWTSEAQKIRLYIHTCR